ncbi:MAG: molybdopterin-binding protein [Rhizobiales bacterium]|nr:molybdopterin-binding protein [Hyphomicrobiales bacterium]
MARDRRPAAARRRRGGAVRCRGLAWPGRRSHCAGWPPGADAVAPFDAVAWHGPVAEAIAPVAPGEGVLTAGADARVGTVLRPAGRRLRHSDVALLTTAGIAQVAVRVPRVRLVRSGVASPIIDAATNFVAGAIAADGGAAKQPAEGAADRLDRAFRDETVDAVIVIGGTGMGRRDACVRALARSGRVAVHGIAISPGETAALGEVDGRPVLLLPGRIDSAIAVWLLLGRPLLARLSGCTDTADGQDCVLSRKVSSSLGLAEVVPVRRVGDAVEPLASGYLSLAALVNADGWILVPPDSEGYPADARVTVRPLP